MKLVNVYVSKDAMTRLVGQKMPAGLAYRILKYSRLFDAEFSIIEQKRMAIIREVTGTPEGGAVTVEPGTPAYAEIVRKVNEVLDLESDLKPSDLKMDDIVAALDAEKGNALSAVDLAELEPFFAT
jgi:hypothetical protein